MDERVRGIEGYVDHVGFRDPVTREGVTLAYFDSEEAITRWRQDIEHRRAQELGRTHFYEDYTLEVARLERTYSWSRHHAHGATQPGVPAAFGDPNT